MAALIWAALPGLCAILALCIAGSVDGHGQAGDSGQDDYSAPVEDNENIVQCFKHMDDVKIELKCDAGSVIKEVPLLIYCSRKPSLKQCNLNAMDDDCKFQLTDKSYIRKTCQRKRTCQICIDFESIRPAQRIQLGPFWSCRGYFGGKIVVHLSYVCTKTRNGHGSSPSTVNTTVGYNTTVALTTTAPSPTTTTPFTTSTTAPPDGNVAQLVTTGESSTTVIIVGCTVGVLGVTIGAAITFMLFRRRTNRDLKMRPANFAARRLDRGHDGPYSNDNVYEDARSFDHPPATEPRPPHNDTPPPVPSRTPSTSESTHLTASRTSSGASSSSDVPPPTPPRSPNSLADHSYLELISGYSDVVRA